MARRKKSLGGSKWFYAQGAKAQAMGRLPQHSWLWLSHNQWPLWAYEAFMQGHYDNNRPWKK